MKALALLACYFLLSLCISLGQPSTLDSLLDVNIEHRDTLHYQHLIRIADEYNKTDRVKALPYYHQARSIVTDLNDIERLGHINKFIGVNHLYLANNDSSKYYLEQSSKYFAAIGDELRIIANNTNIALIHQRNNETEKAVELYHQVISDAENIEEWIEVIFAKINLASVLINQMDHDGALKYLQSIDQDYDRYLSRLTNQIKKADPKLNNKEVQAKVEENADYQFITANYPSIYINQGICYEQIGKLDSAIIFQTKAIEASGNNPYVSSYAYNNLGSIYQKESRWVKALNNFENGLKGFISINNLRGQIFSLSNIGASQSKLANYSAADTSLRKALQLAKSIDFIIEIKDGYRELAENFAAQNMYDSAYVNYKEYINYKDSINNETRVEAIQKWETKYETEKEREEVTRLALENELKTKSQRIQFILFIVGILGLMGLGLYLYTRYRLKKEREVADYERSTNQAMAKFVPMEFVKTLGKDNIKDVALGDEVEKKVTVLFSDIRNFSGMSELMTPVENFRFVKRYVERMSPIIHSNGGFINQYLGDGIMAIFQNAPDNALRACIQMQNETEEFNKELVAAGQDPIRVGMGMHTGMLVMGIIGDESRQDAAIISDTVNSAARMESLTKSYGNKIMFSKSLLLDLKDPDQFHIRNLGQAMVKGKKQPLEVYEAFDCDAPISIKKKTASLNQFESAVQAYYNRNFEDALAQFEQIYEQDDQDLVAWSFIKRIDKQGAHPVQEDIGGAKYH